MTTANRTQELQGLPGVIRGHQTSGSSGALNKRTHCCKKHLEFSLVLFCLSLARLISKQESSLSHVLGLCIRVFVPSFSAFPSSRPHCDRFLCPPQPCPSNVIKQAAPLDSTNQSTEPFILPLGSAGRP